MAFVRTRKTSSGATSTALVESYRDPRGRPRQRILANLYGASSTLEAVARLAAQRAELKDQITLGKGRPPWGLMVRVVNYGRNQEEARRFWGVSLGRLGKAITALPPGFPR